MSTPPRTPLPPGGALAPAIPRWVVFQLVEACNLRCRMCYEWGAGGTYHANAHSATLDYAVFERVVQECLPARPYFEFFGGEPLLYPRVADAIALITGAGCELGIPTNGVLLDRHAELLLATAPTRLWISLDGPRAINDAQRGDGVFERVTRGIAKLRALRTTRGKDLPRLGITCVVTPHNHLHIEELFLQSLDLDALDHVSIEFQNYATAAQVEQYATVLRSAFGVERHNCARGYLQDPAHFAGMDHAAIEQQMLRVRAECDARGILFFSHPRTISVANIAAYFSGQFAAMADAKAHCAFPWLYAEVSARGEVTTCHSFYDHDLGNVNEQSLLSVWHGPRLRQLRTHLRQNLFPICTACCRYYNNPAPTVRARAGGKP